MPYQKDDKVIVVNGSSTWPGTVEAVRDGPLGPRYAVRVSDYTVADVGEAMLAPAPPPQEKEATE